MTEPNETPDAPQTPEDAQPVDSAECCVSPADREQADPVDIVRGLVGAVLGAVAGFFVCRWAMRYGFYAIAIPGMLAGVGAGRLARKPNKFVAWASAGVALVAGLLSEALLRPFVADESLVYFFQHLQDLTPITWILLAVGVYCGYWFTFRPGCRC